MTEELPMFHSRRGGNSTMQWVLAAMALIVMMYAIYTIYDLRRTSEEQRLQVSNLNQEKDSLSEQIADLTKEKSKMSKLVQEENNRNSDLIATLKDEKAAVQKNCARDKQELESSVKDMAEKVTDCKAELAVSQRDKAKLESDFNDLQDKYGDVSRNLEHINEARAKERLEYQNEISSLQTRINTLESSIQARAQQPGHSKFQSLAQGVSVAPVVGNDFVKTKTTQKSVPSMTEAINEVREPLVAQVAPPKHHDSDDGDEKKEDIMQVVPPKPHLEYQQEQPDDTMQVNAPHVSKDTLVEQSMEQDLKTQTPNDGQPQFDNDLPQDNMQHVNGDAGLNYFNPNMNQFHEGMPARNDYNGGHRFNRLNVY